MLEPLFTDHQEITNELSLLLKNKARLNLYQQNKPVQPVLIQCLSLGHEPPLVVILKKNNFQAEEGGCCLLYRPDGQNPRGFNGTICKQSEHRLGILLPVEIFQIQRRRSGRYSTPPPSKVIFTLKDGQRLYNGQVINISLEGARVIGQFPPHLRKDMVIGPLSFSLHLQFVKNEITCFTSTEAVIAWTAGSDNEIKEMGLRLRTAPAEMEKLEPYIEIRSLEEAAVQPVSDSDAVKGSTL